MLIDDEFIKRHIAIYKATRSSITLHDINEHIAYYIYNYPRKIFKADHEKALDFYLYYIERIENIILHYEESEVKFITWLTHTLRNSYLNYIDKIKRKNKYQKPEVSLDSRLISNDAFTFHDIISLTEEEKYDIDDIASKMFDYIKREFDLRDALIFGLHNLELFLSVIIRPAMEYFNINYEEAYKIIENARATYINKYNDIIKYQDTVAKINMKISDANRKGFITVHLASKKQASMKRLNSIRIVVPYAFLSSLFNISVNVVAKAIKKIKETLKSNFKF